MSVPLSLAMYSPFASMFIHFQKTHLESSCRTERILLLCLAWAFPKDGGKGRNNVLVHVLAPSPNLSSSCLEKVIESGGCHPHTGSASKPVAKRMICESCSGSPSSTPLDLRFPSAINKFISWLIQANTAYSTWNFVLVNQLQQSLELIIGPVLHGWYNAQMESIFCPIFKPEMFG